MANPTYPNIWILPPPQITTACVTLLYKIVKICSISALSILALSILKLSILYLINFVPYQFCNYQLCNYQLCNYQFCNYQFCNYQFCTLSILCLINFVIINFVIINFEIINFVIINFVPVLYLVPTHLFLYDNLNPDPCESGSQKLGRSISRYWYGTYLIVICGSLSRCVSEPRCQNGTQTGT